MIPEATVPAAADMRTVKRSNLFLAATINFGEQARAVRIRDLSADGAQLEGLNLPEIGAEARIRRGRLCAVGKVVWRSQARCGVRFDETLALGEWLGRDNRGQHQVDRIVAGVKSGAPALERRPHSKVDSRKLPLLLAEEIACVARMLDSVGDCLANEPAVVMRHPEQLQGLDIARQILGHLASIVVADEPDAAIQAVGMESLRRRLQRRPVAPQMFEQLDE